MNSKEDLFEEYKGHLVKEKMPIWVDPMLATLTVNYFDDPDWIFERKFDGERILAYKDEGGVILYSRNRKNLNQVYPEIVSEIENQGGRFIVDGEIVAFDGASTSFSRLQQRMHKTKTEEIISADVDVYYYIFDILHVDGFNTRNLDLRLRKRLLKVSLSYHDPLRFTEHVDGKGISYHKEACRKGWEGVIAKDAASKYLSKRSKKWLKFKCRNQQEFVIGGYTEPEGERTGFGALLLGYYKDKDLLYAGKVGTGFTDDFLEYLWRKLIKMEIKQSPYLDEVNEKDVHWVRPELVCEVRFSEWTSNNRLRHPSFLGLRDDKSPSDVVRESPE